ncbi:disulfide bond formation protein B [Candidatus Pelagibacter communis]|uniref:disulfide bond formation protein B n=1 Tax=Pelagibacter ubique TaxID=198252 RepID=UPI00094D69EB|nr:disulfide bond formation protein B [Candidatus Pelagibacter ubique]|tara:strand:- start:942 stop:1430 length:489 start_codon:yes stop_codon:yes gene_type:complete
MLKNKIQIYLNIILFISFVSIISAFFIEYILGHQPCNLCLMQRIPYVLTIFLIITKLLFKKKEQFIILLLIITFSFSFILSFYHFGIEQGFFEESSVCGLKNISDIITKEEILNQLKDKIVSCKDVTFRIFGFSLTSFNMVISLVLLILLTKIFVNYEKLKK